jgi:hypothetical protein
VTHYLDLPGPRGKLERLLSEYGAMVLPGSPPALDEVPPDKALVCVGDKGGYETAGYIITETELAAWTDPAGTGPKTWLLLDRGTADRLCADAAQHRQSWQSSIDRYAQAAAHTDNRIPVARASRGALRRDAELLREYAAALGGDEPRQGRGGGPADIRQQRIAAADLADIAEHLESWAERDWIAVIDLGPEREHLAGPLPRFPGTASPDSGELPPMMPRSPDRDGRRR